MLDKLRREKAKEVIVKKLIRDTLIIIAVATFLFYGLKSTNEQMDDLREYIEKEKVSNEVKQASDEVEQINNEVLVSTIPPVVKEVVNELEKAQKQGVEANTEELIDKLMADGYTLSLEDVELKEIYENYRIVGISFGDKKITVENKYEEKKITEVI